MALSQISLFNGVHTFTPPAGCYSVNVMPIYSNDFFITSNSTLYFKSRGGFIYAVGGNNFGQLGDNTLTNKSNPVNIANFRSLPVLITNLSSSFAFALDNSGDAYAWGDNSASFPLGVGDFLRRSSPTLVVGGVKFSQLVLSSGAGIAGLSLNGKIYVWQNTFGLSGASFSSPTLVTSSQFFTDILAADGYSAFAVGSDGNTYTFGFNTFGQLGVNSLTTVSSPTLISGGYKFVKIASAPTAATTYGLTNDYKLYAWGWNGQGQIGDNTITNRSSPVLVMNNIKTCSKFEIGSYYDSFYNHAIDNNGALYGWGDNSLGYLGDGTTTNRSTPTQILAASGAKFKKVVSSGPNTYALTENGQIYAWGANNFGQLGNNTVNPTLYTSSPVLVVGNTFFVDVITSFSSVFAQANDGQIYAWGDNSGGQLSSGTTANRSSPVAIASIGAAFRTGIPNKNNRTNSVLFGAQNGLDIAVTPNTQYNVIVGANTSFFGTTPVSFGPIEKIVITFQQ